MIKSILLAGAGGFVGTCLRFLTARLCQMWHLGGFPLGTFAVNVVGCFIIGALLGWGERSSALSPAMNVMLVTGFCGGLTTFSSFANDAFLLFQHRQWLVLSLYIALSLILGIIMVWVGRSLVKGL